MARPRKQPPASPAGGVSQEVLKITGKRVGGRWERGSMVRVGTQPDQCPPELAQSLIAKGLAVWNGDDAGAKIAAGLQRMAANKAAAEQTMRSFDSMSPEDRAQARESDPEEGSDV